MKPIVAIVGRPNVGKSTLFNRLSRSKGALVDNIPGITRDRIYTDIGWGGKYFTIIDTGGFDELAEEPLLAQVKGQVEIAVQEADKVIFLVDGPQGVMPGDQDIIDILRKSKKDFMIVANKVDGPEHEHLIADFFSLGINKIYPVSAAHGFGLKDFMAELVDQLPDYEPENARGERIRVSILGRPNVGKSSLINRILGFERVLVSDLPGTTRDAIDTIYTYQGREYQLIDTAGIRRKARVKEKIDKFSMIKALKSLDRCHIAIIVLDASAGIAEQDARICGYAFERKRGIILAVNKWDIVKKDPDRKKQVEREVERQLNFVPYAPKLNISALTGEKVKKLFDKIDLLYNQFSRRVNTGEANRAIKNMLDKRPPPLTGQGRLKFYYVTQTGTRPPCFVVFVNKPKLIHFSYKRFIENQIREQFNLSNSPVKLIFREKSG